MDDAISNKVPTLFLRFEDLVSDPETQLMDVMRFLLGTKDLKDTNAERRVKEVIAKGSKATRVYNLKEGTSQFNSNGKRYNEAQIEYVKQELQELIYFFGYAKTKDDPDNFTGFFTYEDEDPDMISLYYGFKAHREQTIDKVCSMSEEELAAIQYRPDTSIDLIDYASSNKACSAMAHYC